MPTNPTRSELETAYKVALMPYFDADCIKAAFESDRGEFDIELGAFDQDNPLNVCALDGDLTSDDFTEVAQLDVIDEGTGYCLLASEGEGAAALVDEVLAVASIVDGELAGIKPRTIETGSPWWWPEMLTPSGRRTA